MLSENAHLSQMSSILFFGFLLLHNPDFSNIYHSCTIYNNQAELFISSAPTIATVHYKLHLLQLPNIEQTLLQDFDQDNIQSMFLYSQHLLNRHLAAILFFIESLIRVSKVYENSVQKRLEPLISLGL